MKSSTTPGISPKPQTPSKAAGALREKIDAKTAVVGIIGQGYVGLPLSLVVAEKGFSTLGFDVDAQKIAALNAGESFIHYVRGERITAARKANKYEATLDFSRLGECDVVLICVPTPLTPQREPDLRYVRVATEQIRDSLRSGQLVVLESTTYPGTTDELVKSILEGETGRDGEEAPKLVCGEDFFLAFSPEREDPGRENFTTATIPKVVGGVDPLSGDLADLFYSAVISKTVRVSSARAAEASKLTENIFRAVNIALANELKMIYDRLGIDVWEVLDAAETKPFGFMRFNPGPGWGGHCIPLDPFYLTWKAREAGSTTRFIELAGEINVQMSDHVVERIMMALNERAKPVHGSRILILGLAYKKNIADPRESPAFEILDKLLDLGASVNYHDPHIPVAPSMRRHPEFAGLESMELTKENVKSQDAVVIITDHDAVDYGMLADHAQLIVDTRGVMRKMRDRVNGRLVQA
ncbi:MAG TPA: nucleotide sugar dehydrogenase [Thermoanaerobaculia bacterium]|nr:nucleotide sugar dehydrogenase [Thermoanaerobaculia bacterium]